MATDLTASGWASVEQVQQVKWMCVCVFVRACV